MLKKTLFMFSIIGLILTILALFIVLRHYVPKGIAINKHKYPITGIDISHHNKKINWHILNNQNLDFVFIKATEGANYKDPEFQSNFKQIKKINIPVGAYHFFRFNRNGYKQAENFRNTVKFELLDLPPVLDVEEWGNNISIKDKKAIQLEISRFINTIELHSKYKVLIYANLDTYHKYIKNKFPNNPIWICSFSNSPRIKGEWVFWQHSHKGKLKGISGFVDLNTFNGNRKKWNQFMNRK